MTTYLLREGHSVLVDARPIAIRVQSSGAPFGHRIEVEGRDGAVRTVRRPDQVIVPRIDQPVRVSLLPDGEVFGPQSVVTVALGPDEGTGSGDVDQAVLDAVDLSGLRRRDIVIMEPESGRIKISTVGVVSDVALPATAEMARDAARELLGLPRLSAEQQVELVVGLDSSASMRRLPPDRLVRAGLEIFAGLSVVIAVDQTVHGSLIGWETEPVPVVPPGEFATAMITALSERPLDIGCRSESLTGSGARTECFLITDAEPARRPGVEPPHIVMINDAGACGELAGTVTAVPVLNPDQTLDRDQVRRVVSSLLAGSRSLIGES